jgi:hypothetical protein
MTYIHLILTGAIGSALAGLYMIINMFFMSSKPFSDGRLAIDPIMAGFKRHIIGMLFLFLSSVTFIAGAIWWLIEKAG